MRKICYFVLLFLSACAVGAPALPDCIFVHSNYGDYNICASVADAGIPPLPVVDASIPPADVSVVPDAGADVTAEAAKDAGADVTADAPKDAVADAPKDAVADVAVDAPKDAVADAPKDAVADVVTPPADAATATRPAGNTGQGFFVVGSKLYDEFGVQFIPRGANDIGFWRGGVDRAATLASMSALGVNAVRIPFAKFAADNVPSQVDTDAWRVQLMNGVINSRMVAIPVAFSPRSTGDDTTGSNDPAVLTAVTNDWVSGAGVWRAFEHSILINIANEWGPENSTVWRDSYISQIARIRAAGINATLIVDAGGSGEDPLNFENYGAAVLASDPQHNICFSVHIYGAFWHVPATESWQFDLTTESARLNATGLCVLFGEFSSGEYSSAAFSYPPPAAVGDAVAAAFILAYPGTVISTAEANGFGWLAWEVFNDSTESLLVSAAQNTPGFYPPQSNLTPFGVTVKNGLAIAKRASIF